MPQRNILILGSEEKAGVVRDILGKYPEYRIVAALAMCLLRVLSPAREARILL